MLIIVPLSCLSGGQTSVDMADYAAANEEFLRGFLRPEHGSPSNDSFSRLLMKVEPHALEAIDALLSEELALRKTWRIDVALRPA